MRHHMAKDSGGVSPTRVSSNRQADLSTRCGPCRSLWTASSPSQPQSRSTWTTLTWEVIHRQETLCGSPGAQRRMSSTTVEQKNIGVGGALKWIEGTAYFCQHHASPKVAQLRAKWDFLSHNFSPGRKENGWASEFPASPAVWDCQRDSCRFQASKLEAPWLGEGRGLGEQQIKLSKGIKGTWSLKAALSGHPPRSHW